MISRLLLVALCLVAELSVLHAQDKPVTASRGEVRLVITTGEEPAKQRGPYLTLPSDVFTTEYMGFIEVDFPETAIVKIKASDSSRRPVETEKLEDQQVWVIKQKGLIYVSVTAVDFETKLFEDADYVLNIKAPEPDVPDVPDKPDVPEVPGDDFGNIGAQIAAKIVSSGADRSAAKQIGALYGDAAEMLLLQTTTQNQVSAWLVDQLNTIPTIGTFDAVRELIRKDFDARWPVSKGVMSDYFRAVGMGFNAS